MPAPTKKAAPAAVAKPAGKPADVQPPEPDEPIDLAAALADGLPEEQEEAARYGITVDQLREIRAAARADIGAAVIKREDDGLDPQADICGVHWPDGWPAGGNHADCEHGTWKR